ncbi:unnamed protein product [Debaryomyces tyrocola]|nr:unnamed protein product [Debaryomyces tyrocola]
MSGWYLMDRIISREYFDFCFECIRNSEKYTYIREVLSFRYKENRKYREAEYINEERDAKRKWSSQKRVKFHPTIITEYIESAWQDKEELVNYRRDLDLLCPDMPYSERCQRRSENSDKTKQRSRNNKLYDRLYMDHPSGLYNLPSYADCDCDLAYESYAIKKKIALELSTAPPIFSHIHPFDDNLTLFFNSYLGRTIDKRPIYQENHSDERIELPYYEEEEIFNMPYEIERRLWVYRIAKFREWKLSFSKNNIVLPTNDNTTGICKYSSSYDCDTYPFKRIEDPMMYFKC